MGHDLELAAGRGRRSDQSLFLGAGASLTAAASSDPDGDKLTYEWSFASRPAGSAAALADGSSVAASFTPDVVGDYTVSLTVTDPAGARPPTPWWSASTRPRA